MTQDLRPDERSVRELQVLSLLVSGLRLDPVLGPVPHRGEVNLDVLDEARLELHYGHHSRECCTSPAIPLEDPDSSVVWEAGNPFEQGNLTLFRTSWRNPNPDKKVMFLDWVSISLATTPILIAITAE